jgi:hypothetical protein
MTDSSLTYVVQSLPWTLAGFIGGCLVTIKVIQTRLVGTLQEKPVTPPKPPPNRRITTIHVLLAMGLVVVALTIASAVQSWLVQQANDRLTQCLVSFADKTADAIDARSKASTEAQKAQIQMWRTIFGQPQNDEGRAEARRVFEGYLNKATASIEAQKTNPYPPPPRDVCPDSAR